MVLMSTHRHKNILIFPDFFFFILHFKNVLLFTHFLPNHVIVYFFYSFVFSLLSKNSNKEKENIAKTLLKAEKTHRIGFETGTALSRVLNFTSGLMRTLRNPY